VNHSAAAPFVTELEFDSILRSDLVAFVQKTFNTISPARAFSPNWHIEAICHQLGRVMRGEIKRLIITIPPRYLKSICSSVALPAWALGHDPSRKVVCVSYSQGLAAKHGNDFRAVMNSDWYRRTFPATRLSRIKNSESEATTTKHGLRLSTSVGGTLTGRGGSLIILDDPIKPEDALSDVTRERVIEWCGNTLISRLDNKETDAIVLIMQRLHVGDLAGYFLQQGGWSHLNLPAIAETEETIEIGPGRFHTRKVGELLHPARESQAALDAIKLAMGSATFAAQYQQTPVPAGGNMIKWEWFKFYGPHEIPEFSKIAISWDTAMKSTELSDYSVGTVWGVSGSSYYLLDLIRIRADYPVLKRTVIEQYGQWHRSCDPVLLIEDAGSGTSLMQDLRAEGIPTIPIRPDREKVIRMDAQTAKIESGAVYLPIQARWLEDLRTEMLAFPHGVHDDQVDSIAQALAWMSRGRALQVF